ncbi:MAG: retropepsin-like aspartic protease [Myxococcales bacterium]
MILDLRHNLPFVRVCITYRGRTAEVPDVLVDTGSASTVISADAVEPLGLVLEPTDVLDSLRGIGGREFVFRRVVDSLRLGERAIDSFKLEIGGMDYGFAISGILGMDFLVRAGAVIDLGKRTIEFPAP